MSQTNDLSAQMDALFAPYNQPGQPGAAVAVIHHGKIVFSKGYGLAQVEGKIPCTPESNFRLASVTKQFTAMGIMILAERGQLSLDDKLPKFFPEFPAYGKDITIRQVLNHTSGLIDYEDVIPEGTTIPVSDRDALLLTLKQDKTYFPPGTQFKYSNTGYALLALVIEQASGHTYADFLKQNVFLPLGMSNSVAYQQGVSLVTNRALGYTVKDGAVTPSDQSLTSAVLGDGGVYSSVKDLFQWDQALYTEKLVKRPLLAQAFLNVTNTSDFPGSGYGFGWYVGKAHGTDHIWHYGSTCGFSTRLERYPQKEFTVIILTNRRSAELDNFAEKIATLWGIF